MPYGDPDPSDPTMLVGIVLPGGDEVLREMAYVFAEEFARLGLTEGGIMALFQNPYYAGAHRAHEALGSEAVRAIVRECVGAWGGVAGRIREAAEGGREGARPLPWPSSAGPPPRPGEAEGTGSTSGEGA